MSVPNHKLQGTEYLSLDLGEVNGTNGDIKKLEDTLIIGVSKGETRYNYPVEYLQDFNYRPYESYVESGILTCSDDAYDDHPEWGWALDSQGERILHSQGFWCSCSYLDIIGIDDSFKRGTTWKSFQLFSGSASAHCLRFNDIYYNAYQVNEPILHYNLDVGFIKESKDPSTGEVTTVEEYIRVRIHI